MGVWGAESAGADKPWAFQPPRRRPLPAVHNKSWVRNPLDTFVLAKLEAAGLAPAPAADRATLIRRLSFDLIGLPPTPAEVEAFIKDTAPDAYERLVDRYLSSPRYGERWAVYWLDLVRFAESDGFRADDTRPTAWRYRDYVINALNQDKPYDRFVREQLAGDELFPNDTDALVATGYLRHYPDEWNAADLELRRQEILNDITDTTSQVFLGLTLGCARCHDHKFDPLAQEDYYRLQAFFAAFKPVDVLTGAPAERDRYEKQLQEWRARTVEFRRRLAELEEKYLPKLVAQRKSRFLPEYQAMFDLSPEKRTPYQEQIAAMVGKQLQVDSKAVVSSMKPEDRKKWQELAKQMEATCGAKPSMDLHAAALTDVGAVAPPTHLLKRGDCRHKGEELQPGFPAVLDERSPTLAPPSTAVATTGRRSALANWLTRPDHPLTARVMVNRLWQHHFGRGIVATPGDFGVQGEAPPHPELLDWLACEFSARGWSLKAMHRLMVTSATYRQSSRWSERGGKLDPDNRLLWHMNRRRLEGEALRDALLTVSGQLNTKMGGPSIFPELPAEMLKSGDATWPLSKEESERNRRSVYVFVKRNLRYPFFSVFDSPNRTETCARRNVSTNAPQALFLLNDRTALEEARAFAGRVLREVGTQPRAVMERAYHLALGRAPDKEEAQPIQRFLTAERERLAARVGSANPPSAPVGTPAEVDPAFAAAVVDLCHALLNVNEFLYVD